TLLFAASAAWPVLGVQQVKVAPRGPGDRGRVAEVELRAGLLEVRHPQNGKREGDPASLAVSLVEAREVGAPQGVTPLHWRLLTTLAAGVLACGAGGVALYRVAWRIAVGFR